MSTELKHPSMLAGIKCRTIPSNMFHWYQGKGSEEISTLKANGFDVMQRVYNDACDVGFICTSHRTGQSRLFSLAFTKEHEGDILWWEFTSYEGRGCTGKCTTITVLND